MSKLKVYVYGAGKEYNLFSSYLYMMSDKIEVLAIVTTSRQKFDFLDGIPCILSQEMDKNAVDYVIVAVEKWEEVRRILQNVGFDSARIIPSRVFRNPYFPLEEYLRLRSSNITILSNSCLGGGSIQRIRLRVSFTYDKYQMRRR